MVPGKLKLFFFIQQQQSNNKPSVPTLIKVPLTRDCLIVNVGEYLSRISNKRFKATIHRVMDIGQDRYEKHFFVTRFCNKTAAHSRNKCCNKIWPPDSPSRSFMDHFWMLTWTPVFLGHFCQRNQLRGEEIRVITSPLDPSWYERWVSTQNGRKCMIVCPSGWKTSTYNPIGSSSYPRGL